MRKKEREQKEAIALRQQGHSIKAIAKELHVSQGSVSSWVRDVKLTSAQRKSLDDKWAEGRWASARKASEVNKQNWRNRRKEWRRAGIEKAREGDPLHLKGCMLYWGEGEKAGHKQVRFCNTDVDMMILFVRFLRESLCISSDEIRIQIRCYLNNGLSLDAIEKYWIDKLGLCKDNFYPAKVENTSAKPSYRTRKHTYGCCYLSVYKGEAIQHILGAIQEYGGFAREENQW